MEEKIIAFCGIDCTACPAYIAHQTDDDALRKKTAEDWSKAFGMDISVQAINCVGCLAPTGVKINYCQECEIRECAVEKQVENCAYCGDYVCDKLEKWFKNVPDAKARLDQIQESLK